MAANASDTVRAVTTRTVTVPMRRPLQTSSGEMDVSPLVLIDLHTEGGITGRSYVFCYTPVVLGAVRELVANIGELVAGHALVPLSLAADLVARFRILRPQGLVQLALSGIDMAAWDALAKGAGLPLVRLLGGEPRPIPAYGSLKRLDPKDVADEAAEEAERGFTAYKVHTGHLDVDADAELVRAIRSGAGTDAEVALDYNQFLTIPEAVRRERLLRDERLLWIEEPTRADDFLGHARIRQQATTPIQIGESWWGLADMTASLAAGASDFGMPDVARLGGVTGWRRAAAQAEAHGLPLSSHLYPEISAHLLAVTPTAHLLEHLDLASPVLAEPLAIVGGVATAPDRPGVGLEWDPDAVERFAVT